MAKIVLERPPKDDEELYWLVQSLWGVTIPRNKVCPDHVAPFEVFADAFFRRGDSITLWKGSRGLSGKSYLMSILGLTIAVIQGSDVNLLGGSLAQSTNIHEHMRAALDHKNAPRYMIVSEANTMTKFTNGAKIRPLTASQKTVRGPHPATLLLDEIDEMDLDILDAALGQPMPQKNWQGEIIKPYTVLCSTHQHPDGTFAEIQKRFEERGLPMKSWCFLDTSNPIDGWLTEDTIENKKREIPKIMWETEYCTSMDSHILMADYTHKSLKDIKAGERVQTRNGPREVLRVWDNGVKETLTFRADNGYELTCTPNHRIATPGGWIVAGSLSIGDALVTSGPSSVGADLVSATAGSHLGALAVQTHSMASLGNDVSTLGVSVLASSTASDTTMLSTIGDVLPATQQTEMVGVTAQIDMTAMLDGHLVGDRPLEGDVTDSMSDDFSSDFQFGIPVLSLTPRLAGSGAVPNPASVIIDGSTGSNVVGELFDACYSVSHVESITNTSRYLHVGDLTVEGEHEYIANGIVVHNCLGEPSIGNRAFDTAAVERMFSLPMEPIESKVQDRFEEYTFEKPVGDGVYVVSADWAKEQDYTVITVLRVDRQPHQLAYYMRVNRRPYPAMIKWFNNAIENYHAEAIHDATGLGNVVNDYIDVRARKFIMTGEKRYNMLTEFVGAVERDYFRFPAIPSAFNAVKYCRTGDLYSGATKDFHLPDEVCSFALAWNAARKFSGYGDPVVVKRSDQPGKYEKNFATEPTPDDGIYAPMYEVVNKTEGMDDGINLMV